MVELEHARALLSDMGLTMSAQLLDAQIERSTGSHDTYVQFLDQCRNTDTVYRACSFLHHSFQSQPLLQARRSTQLLLCE